MSLFCLSWGIIVTNAKHLAGVEEGESQRIIFFLMSLAFQKQTSFSGRFNPNVT